MTHSNGTSCLITIHVDGKEPFDTELVAFLAENELSSEDLQVMFAMFGRHECYEGGGGATPMWAVALSNGEPRQLLF